MNDFQPTTVTLLVMGMSLGAMTFVIVTTTSFIKISVVMFLLRNALGIQQTPPNLVLYGIALVLTIFISAPVMQKVYQEVQSPETKFETFQDWIALSERAREPVREFLVRFTRPAEREFFSGATQRVWPEDMRKTVTTSDLAILIPSFVISELRRAFEIGFLIYLPFIAVDLIISAILMALGMSMVPPLTISVPFKLFLFVSIEGWSKLFHGLVLSYS